MERRRCLIRGYRLALLTGALAGLLLCLALTLQSPVAECRETMKFAEDAGDPDMPDRVESGSVRASGFAVYLTGDAHLPELDSRETAITKPVVCESRRANIQTRRIVMYLLSVWSSVASWRFAL